MTTPADSPIFHIRDHGQSIWMDNLSRDLLESGELQTWITDRDVRGITSNPAIFEKAIAGNAIYDPDIAAGIGEGQSITAIYETLVFDDIQKACDILRPVYEASQGLDGYVSIEVSPHLAHDTETTLAEARRYAQTLDRPNLMIKIPGTPAGLPAVTQAISDGISVNVTLLFAVDSYVKTAWAYIEGLEQRASRGEAVDGIASVASFFLSRIDSAVDQRLDALIQATADPDRKAQLAAAQGKVAIANAKIAYQEYKKIVASDRWQALAAKGARMQRLLWASTGTKNPAYSDVLYVDQLVGPDTVNTLPPATIEACADHCDVASRIETDGEAAHALLANLQDWGIDLDHVMAELLEDGITKFVQPFDSLMASLAAKVQQLTPP
ncbi:transaldolase [Prochlorothrix hollandica]|uniref:transaldolase n=1 Tax=Prochlorothrix hollandica TaxID=1223 RepID=UPI003341A82D